MSRPRKQAVFVLPFLFLLLGAATARAQSPQPIAFSHKVHVTANGIACRFCHVEATRSRYAGIPSVAKCMICHRAIATGKPEIKKLSQYWSGKKPIPWVRVTDLPDHVYFPHFRMVNAGIPCLTCHPGTDQAEAAERKRDFTMGWCMECHRKKNASIDCWACHT